MSAGLLDLNVPIGTPFVDELDENGDRIIGYMEEYRLTGWSLIIHENGTIQEIDWDGQGRCQGVWRVITEQKVTVSRYQNGQVVNMMKQLEDGSKIYHNGGEWTDDFCKEDDLCANAILGC